MTILFMGSDLTAMDNTASTVYEVSTASVPFTGLGLRVGGGSGESAETVAWAAQQDVWLHFTLDNDILDSIAGNIDIAYFMNGADAAYKLHRDSSKNFKVSYLSAPATYTQVGTNFTLPDAIGYLDINIVTGASGSATVYLDGVERMPTGSASMTYSTDITSVQYLGGGLIVVGGVVVATEPTIGWRLGRLAPLAAGASTAWTGDYTSIDETTLNEADYIYSGTANQVETFTITLTPTITGYVPRAVAVSARARRGASGPANLQLALRSGSTDYFSSSKSLGLGFSANLNIWETNPDTSADWTSAQLSSLQIGVKSIT